jgi:hypothetical protein
MLSRGFDLNDPIPEFQQNPPTMPQEALTVMNQPYSWTGAWIFTNGEHPTMFDPPKAIFLPCVGLALRVNDRTSIRVGYRRTVAEANECATS